MTKIIGIDLGTTNSGVAVWQDGAPHLILDADGHSLTPSIVAFDPETATWVVGRDALRVAEQDPRLVVKSIKRFIGRRFPGKVLHDELEKLHILYEVEESSRGKGRVDVVLGEEHLTPQQISARILQKLKADAEAYLGYEVTEAVITVPAYFNADQRQATRDAGRLAGLEVKRVLNEPTAAYLAFGYAKLADPRQTVVAYDLGGGTFDVSILEVGRGPFSVRATNGNTLLGGDDLDWKIVDWVLDRIEGVARVKLEKDIKAQFRLRIAAEQAKIALSDHHTEEVMVQVSGELSPASGVQDLAVPLPRTQLETLAQQFIADTLEPCRQALHDAKLAVSDIEEILLVGGQTRMPAIRRAVEDFFGLKPNTSVDPDEVVARGSAIQAAILAGEQTGLVLADVVPLTLGVQTEGGLMDAVIERNARMPIRKTKTYSTTTDDQESVEIQVHQGEKPRVADNVKLDSFILGGIEPAPAGQPEIEVTFDVDRNGILKVSAKDVYTGLAHQITITDSVRLSDDEIKAMIHDAKEHALEYDATRRHIEMQQTAQRHLDRLNQFQAEKGDKFSAELVMAIQEVQTVPDSDELETYLSTLRDLLHQANEAGQGKG